MQLSRVLTRAGKAMWLLLLVPLLAIGATTAYLWNAPPDVHTFATVSVIAPEGQSTAATVTQAVDGFKSAVVSDTVAQLAAEDAGADLDVGHDLTAERVGTSNLVELRLTTEPGEDGDALLRALVARTNDALFSSTTRIRRGPGRAGAGELRRGDRRPRRSDEESGLLLPIEAYRAKAQRGDPAAGRARHGDASVDREAVQARLETPIAELDQIGESVNELENVQDQVIRTRDELATANQELDNVETRQQAASADESITVSELRASRTGGPRWSAARSPRPWSALALGGGLVLLIGLLRGPRRGRAGPRAGATAGQGGAPDGRSARGPPRSSTSAAPAAAAARCSPTCSARCRASVGRRGAVPLGARASCRTGCAAAASTSPPARSGTRSSTRRSGPATPARAGRRWPAAARRASRPRTRLRTLPAHLREARRAPPRTTSWPTSWTGCTPRSRPWPAPTWSSTPPSCRRTPRCSPGCDGIDLRVAHLVRDPRAAAYSWRRTKRQPDLGPGALMERRGAGKSAVLWSVWNRSLEMMCREPRRRLRRLTYEEFLADPRAAGPAACSTRSTLPPATSTAVFAGAGHRPPVGQPHGRRQPQPAPARAGPARARRRVADRMSRDRPRRGGALTWPTLRRYGYRLRG